MSGTRSSGKPAAGISFRPPHGRQPSGGVGLETELVLVRDAAGHCVAGGLLVVKRLKGGIGAAYVARGPVADPLLPWASTLALDATDHRPRALLADQLPHHPAAAGGEQLDPELGAARVPGGRSGGGAWGDDSPLTSHSPTSSCFSACGRCGRREIRRAVVRGSRDISPSFDVELFHRLHAATAMRQGFAPLSLEYLRHQWTELASNRRLVVLIARHAGQPVAGVWLTSFNGVVTFRLAGWDASIPSPKYVNEALHWSAIQWARLAGAGIYDLGGLDRNVAERLLRGGNRCQPILPVHTASSSSGSVVPPCFFRPRAFYFQQVGALCGHQVGLLAGRYGDRIAHRFRNG